MFGDAGKTHWTLNSQVVLGQARPMPSMAALVPLAWSLLLGVRGLELSLALSSTFLPLSCELTVAPFLSMLSPA